MIRLFIALIAVAAPASVEATVTFDFGKSLPLANGQWSYIRSATGGEARFGAQLSLSCDKRTRTVAIRRPGLPAASLTIVTDVQSRELPSTGVLSAHDSLLDAIAFSRGRFLVAGGGGAVLAVPSWPESARAIEDCRN